MTRDATLLPFKAKIPGDAIVVVCAFDTTSLSDCEMVIQSAIDASLEASYALVAIHDNKLYRTEGYPSFENYLAKRWGWSRTRGYQMLDAVKTDSIISSGVSTMVDTPTPQNERQTRPLASLPASRRTEAWLKAVEIAGGQPTGRQVAQAVGVVAATSTPTSGEITVTEITTTPVPSVVRSAEKLAADMVKMAERIRRFRTSTDFRKHLADIKPIVDRYFEVSLDCELSELACSFIPDYDWGDDVEDET